MRGVAAAQRVHGERGRRNARCQFPAPAPTAADYARYGIRVNSVSPGVIRTPLTMAEGQKEVTERLAARIPEGRLGEPEEIAAAVAFLLSGLSGYTTGADLVVDGAFLLRE